MEDDPLFSVLLANYNNEKYLDAAIQSVFDQEYKSIEIVVVDDCSQDGSFEKLKSYGSKIRLYKNDENMGVGYTKRRVCDLAKGQILGFLDPDDTLVKEAVNVMVQEHLKHPDAALVSSSHYVCNENLEITRLAYGAKPIPTNESYLSYGKGITAFATFKRAFYKETDGINPTFKRAVDQDLYYKLEETGDVIFIDRPLYYYRIYDGSVSTHGNLSKSRYWFTRAKEDAFERRIDMPNVKNITKKELKSWWSVVYLSKAADAIKQFRFCSFIFWFVKSISQSQMDRHLLLKIKILFLNTVFHKFYLRFLSK